MHTLDPSVVEAWEAQAEQQELKALAAWNRGDKAARDIFKAASAETRAKIEHYKRNSREVLYTVTMDNSDSYSACAVEGCTRVGPHSVDIVGARGPKNFSFQHPQSGS
jgi:hypothetical protein